MIVKRTDRKRWMLLLTSIMLATVGSDEPVWGEDLMAVSAHLTIPMPPESPRTHAAVITAVRIHPDGQLVAAAGDDHVIRLWDLTSGMLTRQLSGHHDWIRALAFSPDGKTLVSSGNDRRLLMWDVETGQLLKTLATHDHAIDAVVFSHSGLWVATAGFESNLCLINTLGQADRVDLECTCRDIRALAISADDRYLAAGGRDGVIRIWDLQSRQLVREFRAHQQRIRAISFVQDSTQIISGGEDRMVRIWNWQTDDQSVELPRLPCKIMAMVPCGPQILATAGSDNTIRLWDLHARTVLGKLTGHTGSVAALDYRNGTLVSGGFDTELRTWTVPLAADNGVRSAQRVK